ncbi:hypothetical protein V9T40_005632 [Parthenolecanium corni]|uniref:Fe2OG dioxygenase domain-containing protein n=1 Tax=Parthenolecanium corni TaxID=536013 RepID=A0AAN9Y9U3_9HEMI
MQLKHAERKHKIDLTMMEDLCKYKMRILEERESHLENEMISLQEEFNAKLQKQKETQEELVRNYNEKLRNLQEEQLTEMKRVAELQSLKASIGLSNANKKNVEEVVSKELTLREIAIEEKQKELLEFEERLNRTKTSLDSKKASIDTRIEEFETKMAKEKLSLEQQKKYLKLSQNILAEKEMYWEREKQCEKDFVTSCKQELEARAELQGTVEEVRRLKSRLETERNEIKKEEMRLKEEKWRLRNIEQEFSFQEKHVQKLLQEAELKKDEGVRALKKAQSIERHLDERVENVEKRMMELNRKEELLTKVCTNADDSFSRLFAGQEKNFEFKGVYVLCSKKYLQDISKYPGCQPQKCGRFVMDNVISNEEVNTMMALVKRGLSYGGSHGGASILDLHTGAMSKGVHFVNLYKLVSPHRLLDIRELEVYRIVRKKIQNVLAAKFGLVPEMLHLTKPTFFSRLTNKSPLSSNDEYWHPHVDKETYPSFHYTTLLYLNDYGIDFRGGQFQFIDNGNSKSAVQPKKGRVLLFTSGQENAHYVEKVISGERYAITISFTCDYREAIPDPLSKF